MSTEYRFCTLHRAIDKSWRVLSIGPGDKAEKLPGTLDLPGSLPSVESFVEYMSLQGFTPGRPLPTEKDVDTGSGFPLMFVRKPPTEIDRIMSATTPAPTPAQPAAPVPPLTPTPNVAQQPPTPSQDAKPTQQLSAEKTIARRNF